MLGTPTLPGSDALAATLTSLLADGREPVTIGDRYANPLKRTFESEVVTCSLPDGEELEVFCKYGAARGGDHFGHRRGVAYEAQVYRDVLLPLGAGVPHCYGSRVLEGDQVCLVLTHLRGAEPLDEASAADAMPRAAEWLGSFHAVCDALPATRLPAFLHRYDRDYYAGWGRRTLEFVEGGPDSLPWLRALCAGFEDVAPAWLGRRLTLIHGECYPTNVLDRDRSVYLIDWESAAVAAGEIDLALLTDLWPDDVVATCERAYRVARWPDGAPDDFETVLTVARLYVRLRWLGDRPEWTNGRDADRLLARARELGQEVGLL